MNAPVGGPECLVILHALAPAAFGGLEHVVQTLARAQQARGHRVHIAAVIGPDETDHAFVRAARAAGLEVHTLVVAPRSYLHEYRLMRDLCRRLGPHVVHTHGYRSDVVDARAARTAGVATVATVHGFTRAGWRNRAYEWLQRRSYGSADAVVAVSRPQVAELTRAGADPGRVHCVPNACVPTHELLDRGAARHELGLDESAFVIGWVGRFGHEKGPDVLVDACRLLQLECDFVASIIGDGALGAALRARVVESGLEDRVRFHGARPDAAALFKAFDVFVLSSRTEGTPIVLFEAMNAGVPIVATRVGGVPAVVSEAEAWLAPPRNPAALAAGIRSVRLDPDAARERALAARRKLASTYDVHSWLDRYDRIYHAVLRHDRAPANTPSPASAP